MIKNGYSMEDGTNSDRFGLPECNSNEEWEIAKYFRQHYFLINIAKKQNI